MLQVMSAEQKKQILMGSGLFQDLEEANIDEIINKFRYQYWPRKRVLSAEDSKNNFHYLLSGRMKVTQVNEQTGRTITLFLYKPGDVFDVMQLITDRPMDGLFEAQDDLELLTLPVSEMRQWIDKNPDFNRTFLPYLGQQMRSLYDLAGNLALHDTESRLAHLIMQNLDHKGEDGGYQLKLINDLSHEVLAGMIGSVRAVVNRQLQYWRKQGIISLDKGQIKINKLEALGKRIRHFELPPPKK